MIKNPYYNEFIQKKDNIIVPAATLIELNRIISNEQEGFVNIAIEDGQIFFETDNVKLVSRLINGKFPEYKHIMPKDYKTRVVGEKAKMQNAVRLASLFSSGAGKAGEVVLKIDAHVKKMLIESSSAESGENTTELKFDIEGPSQEIIFNYKYLLDGISTITTNQMAILSNNEATPVAIKEIDEKTGEVLENFTYIVMPIKN
jgi:DNA polymerase III subunit beta